MIDPTGLFDDSKYAKLAFDNNKKFQIEKFSEIKFLVHIYHFS